MDCWGKSILYSTHKMGQYMPPSLGSISMTNYFVQCLLYSWLVFNEMTLLIKTTAVNIYAATTTHNNITTSSGQPQP